MISTGFTQHYVKLAFNVFEKKHGHIYNDNAQLKLNETQQKKDTKHQKRDRKYMEYIAICTHIYNKIAK